MTPLFSRTSLFMFCLFFIAGIGSGKVWAQATMLAFETPAQEQQYHALITEFRCPKCQNQNLASSDAPIAQDLKKKTYSMVKAGKSSQEIRRYMVDRYGDFISYQPPVNPETSILWFFPPLFLVVFAMGWFLTYRRTPHLSVTQTDNHTNKTAENPSLNEQDRG